MGKASRRKQQSASFTARRVNVFREGDPIMLKALCMDCVDYIQKIYPHVAWGIKPSEDGSMIELVADVPGIDTRHGFMIRTQDIENVTMRRRNLMNMGGEILERFGMSRHKKTEVAEIMGKRNTRGQLQPEL